MNTNTSVKNNSSLCPECGSDNSFSFDPFGTDGLLDEHMDTEISEDQLNERINNALDLTKRLGGKLAANIEQELGDLVKPKLSWQDFVRFIKAKKTKNNFKNDWNVPKRKPLFYGMFVPQNIDYYVNFLLAYDCSGSMNKEQITYGISQVAALDERGEGYCLPWDSEPYFDHMIKIKNATNIELKNAKYCGGGGTVLTPVFKEYEAKIGHVDIIIIVSDFYLADLHLLHSLEKPKDTDVIWLSVNGNPKFKPPFGRLFNLYNE